jgi:aminopeptidase N
VNAGGWGVYRVAYSPATLAQLANHLDALSALERANLFSDTWASVLARHVAIGDFLALGAHLGDDDEPSTWSVLAGALGLCERIVDDVDRGALEAATRRLYSARADELGWEPATGEGERIPSLRSLVISTLGTIGADGPTRREAHTRFAVSDAEGHPNGLDPDLEGAVLAVVAERCDIADYERCLARYRSPRNPQEENRYLNALAAFPDVDLCERTFALTLDEVRTQNAPYLIAALLANRVGGPAVWERVKEHWDTLLERFPLNSHNRMLGTIRTLCRSSALAEDVSAFLCAHPLRSGQRSVDQALERLAINVSFARQHRQELGTVLAAVAEG